MDRHDLVNEIKFHAAISKQLDLATRPLSLPSTSYLPYPLIHGSRTKVPDLRCRKWQSRPSTLSSFALPAWPVLPLQSQCYGRLASALCFPFSSLSRPLPHT